MAVYHLCRICLTEGTNTDAMQPLFEEEDSHCAEIVRMIEECGGIELKPHDEFPKLICEQCLHILDTSYKFRTMCQASEQALLDAIVKSELKSEPHEAVNIDLHKSNNETEIFFDLRTEIIEAEEVDIDVLAKVNGFDEESLEDFVGSEDDVTTNSEIIPIQKRGVNLTKKIVGRVKRKHRLKLMPITSAQNPPGRGRRKKIHIEDQIMCEICGNIYSKRSKLNMHMRRHLAEKPFECEICAKTFACPSEIRRHMRVHTGEKPFVCKFCGRTFADRSTNIKHERIHTKERPFSCKTCGKAFTYSNVLKNHMLTHTGEKPFCCSPCNKTFSRKHQLDQHYATLTHQHTVKNNSSLSGAIEKNDISNDMLATERNSNLGDAFQLDESFDIKN